MVTVLLKLTLSADMFVYMIYEKKVRYNKELVSLEQSWHDCGSLKEKNHPPCVALFREVCHCGGRLSGLICSSYAQCQGLLLPADQEMELTAPFPFWYLPACCHVPP